MPPYTYIRIMQEHQPPHPRFRGIQKNKIKKQNTGTET